MANVEILMRHPRGVFAFVKTGFSWPAFFLGTYWAIVKRMWFVVVLMMAAELLVFATNLLLHPASALIGALVAVGYSVVYALLRGFFGNRWLMASLRRRGFIVIPR